MMKKKNDNKFYQYIQFNFGGPDVMGFKLIDDKNKDKIIRFCLDTLLNDARFLKGALTTKLIENIKRYTLIKSFFTEYNIDRQKETCNFYHPVMLGDFCVYQDNSNDDNLVNFDDVFNSDIYKNEYENLFKEVFDD